MDYKLLLIFHTADYQTLWPLQDQGPRTHFLEILISRYQRSPSFLFPTNRIINHHFHHDQKCPDITDHQPSGKRVSLPPATVGLDQKSSPVYSWSFLPSTSFAGFHAVSILSVPTKNVCLLAPSGALVFIMVYYIPSSAAQRTHFFRFFKFFRFESESESERTQHVLYF